MVTTSIESDQKITWIAPGLSEIRPDLSELVALLPKLNAESDRGFILVVCSFLDVILKEVVLCFLRPGADSTKKLVLSDRAPLQSFSAKIDFCHAGSLISDDIYENLQILRKIRNEFAHKVSVDYADKDIVKLISKFKNLESVESLNPRQKVQSAAIPLILQLLPYPDAIRKQHSDKAKR
jgi:mannitol operon repressor